MNQLRLASKLYSKKAVLSTCFAFPEEKPVLSLDDDHYTVTHQSGPEFQEAFHRRLQWEALRHEVEQETAPMRDLILAQAFSRILL